MKFRVYSKNPDAGWSKDWFWAPDQLGGQEHGPFTLRVWAWLAAAVAWVKGGGSV